ncbi:MAG: sugar ABC transporter permease [Chloroflexota bacterium]|nr:MAG: sugar ABC transporter permease [Chloroflexota bacterium]
MTRATDRRIGLLFVAPAVIGLVAFVGIPAAATAVLSLFQWDVLTPPRYLGLANYSRLLTDSEFGQVMRTTLVFVGATVVPGVALALALGMAVVGPEPIPRVARVALLVPVCASSIGVSLIWRTVLNTDFGPLNAMLSVVGISAIPWLSDGFWSMVAMAGVAIWKGIGYDVAIVVAGLRLMPSHVFEAAALDGASAWQRVRHVALPLMTPTIVFLTVIGMVRSAHSFDIAFALTGGGPARATTTAPLLIYQRAFQFFDMGYAAAMAWVLLLAIALVLIARPRSVALDL